MLQQRSLNRFHKTQQGTGFRTGPYRMLSTPEEAKVLAIKELVNSTDARAVEVLKVLVVSALNVPGQVRHGNRSDNLVEAIPHVRGFLNL
jgi:hypothetical protein